MDYSTASHTASDLDDKIKTDSRSAAGQDYLTITSLSARQALGGVQLTNNITSPLLSMKEISSSGNIRTVDLLFPFLPILLYLNPSLLKPFLDRLYMYQASGQWNQSYSIHDLGSHFPNATGHPNGNAEAQPLEECGNMILITLAYWQRTADMQYLRDHYATMQLWTHDLISDALIPENQISTDDFAGPLANQTNQALKGILAIKAMGRIANLADHAGDAGYFDEIATSYLAQWQQFAISSDKTHTTLSYGNDSSQGLLYNLYIDRLSNLDFVPQDVYHMQSFFYPAVARKYGVPLDTRHDWTKSDWMMWCAAVAGEETRDMFVGRMVSWLEETDSRVAFSDWWAVDDAR